MALRDFKLDAHGWPVTIAAGLLIGYLLLAVFTGFSAVTGRFGELLLAFRADFNLAYSLIPIYLSWIVADYYQERRGTSFGNAISNGFMGLWVGMDWLRTAQQKFAESGAFGFMIGKSLFAVGILSYAAYIVWTGIQAKKIVHYVGRIREVSYFAIMIAPLVYEAVPVDTVSAVAIIAFFPIFYGIAEFIDYYILPPSKAELAEQEETKEEVGGETEEKL